MTESRRLRSGFARPWYQPPRQRPSAPAAPAAPVAPATGPPPVPRHESRKEDPNKAPVVEKCGHTIHPAYAEFYPHLLCPLCRLEKTINEALRPAQILMERGGQVAWNNDILATTEKDSIEREQAKKFFHSIVPQSRKKAGKPKPFDLHVDEDGNISFPRARSGAWNRIRELEMFRDAEVAWYGLCPYEKVDEPLRVRVHDAWKHDALNALTRWEKKHREAVSDRVIKQMRM
jgi:quinol monooxygenase YgiN